MTEYRVSARRVGTHGSLEKLPFLTLLDRYLAWDHFPKAATSSADPTDSIVRRAYLAEGLGCLSECKFGEWPRGAQFTIFLRNSEYPLPRPSSETSASTMLRAGRIQIMRFRLPLCTMQLLTLILYSSFGGLHSMEKLVDIVAPRSAVDLLVKALVLVGVFTAFDFTISRIMQDITNGDVSMELIVTFLIGAPFGLFVLGIMAGQRKLKVRLRHLSRFDSMTGLANRRYFLKQVEGAIAKDERCVLLMLDVDHFKKVNDTWGHAVGDECLKSVGYVLARCARTDDFVGRLGGEEFGILLRDTCIDRISGIAENLLKPIPFNAGERLEHLTGTMSIGAVEICMGGDLNSALVAADMALYQAKQNGRARLEIAA